MVLKNLFWQHFFDVYIPDTYFFLFQSINISGLHLENTQHTISGLESESEIIWITENRQAPARDFL